MSELIDILNDIADGKKNSLGDYWSLSYIKDAVIKLEENIALKRQIRMLESFMIKIAAKTNCLPDFTFPDDNEHIFAAIDEQQSDIKELAEALKEATGFIHGDIYLEFKLKYKALANKYKKG